MHSPFFLCRKEDDYQKRMDTLLAEVYRRQEVPSVVATDSLVFANNIGCFYFMSVRTHRLSEFHFEERVW